MTFRRTLAAACLGLGACRSAPPPLPSAVAAVETAFLDARTQADRINVRQGRGEDWAELLPGYRVSRERLLGALAATDSGRLPDPDRAAFRTIREVTATTLLPEPAPVVGEGGETAAPACQYDADELRRNDGPAALSSRIMACYGREAGRIVYQGRTLDRLTIFGLLGTTDDRAERERLFKALMPVWRSVNGANTPDSPWRILLASRAGGWRDSQMPHVARAGALGVSPDSVEPWLERVLAAWRAAQPDTVLEPWDWYHFTGAAARRLEARIPRERLRALNDTWYRRLGADPAALRIQFDLDPRPGKYPVAYTTFGARPFLARDGWDPGSPFISAAYRIGGLDNLVELLHETGHAVHIAGIRARPAWADWPDSDTFTEAVADLASHDAFEPRWQLAMLGDSVARAEGLRGRYGGVVLDMAWALFEIRMFREPGQDPNRVWADVTGTYLGIRPHPEWSWWAMRGQLIESPGYMLNYALGGVLTAALRARILAERGDWLGGDPEWYPWVRDRLFRFGAARPAAEVIRDFLGGPLAPEAILADLARGRK